MSDIRRDPLTGRWVIIAPDRAKRPHDGRLRDDPKQAAPSAPCPFDEGNEGKTPPELLSCRPGGGAPDTPGWRVRVVPNRFPALEREGAAHRTATGPYERIEGIGVHEVVIESPEHITRAVDLPPEQLALALETGRERMAELATDDRIEYALLFKNSGRAGGASLEHVHSQIIATPFVPKTIAEELHRAEAYHHDVGHCLLCDLVAEEQRAGERIVAANDAFLAFCPFAPRFPYETWIVPTDHRPRFERSARGEIDALAAILHDLLVRLDAALDDPPYNAWIHTTPRALGDAAFYHWHLELTPQLGPTAGFERGSDCFINTVAPEKAAKHLRSATEA